MNKYFCKECGKPIKITEDKKVIRSCNHTGTIIAGMDAITKGISKVN